MKNPYHVKVPRKKDEDGNPILLMPQTEKPIEPLDVTIKQWEEKRQIRTMTAHDKLLNYMFGFYTGAGVKAIDPKRQNDDDFKRGMEDGRKARNQAYKQACLHYGTKLEVLKAMGGGN